jgi:hypothetical protein
VLVSLAIAAQLVAASAPTGADPFMEVFAQTCMTYASSQEKIGPAMRSRGSAELPQDKARPFLGRQVGRAWGLQQRGRQYVLVVTDTKVCSVLAKDADIGSVKQDFVRMISTAPPPLSSRELHGGPSGAGVETTTYAWARATDNTQLMFVLTVSSDPRTLARAMASVSITRKAP